MSSKKRRIQRQTANAKIGSITQVGRDFTNAKHIQVEVWISVVFITILAISAATLIRLKGEFFPEIEIQTNSEEISTDSI
ncbi:MAG: hypothetical protein AAF215_22835 [Cyanobacteria bacterium P01_A01_bin.123]